ncbi:hypothetical protein D5086_004798 [Populus alba]|uniref:Uncharacterized protein n=1 Tax=Populus alba TaxID=43335 RepID=A0ACC4CRI3_POPAL
MLFGVHSFCFVKFLFGISRCLASSEFWILLPRGIEGFSGKECCDVAATGGLLAEGSFHVSSRAYVVSGREVSQAPKLQTGLVRDVAGRFNAHQSQITDFPVPVRPWKGKDSAAIEDDLMLDVVVTSKGSGDSFDEGGPSSFSGASHPPEPIDTDLIMKTVYVPISQKKAEPGCLVKSMSVKGPFLEDLSIRVSPKKPSPVILSPAESLVEEPNDLLVLPSPFTVPRASQNTENSLLPPDSEEKECVWDASLPPSGNVSPHSSIDSTGVVTAMSIVNSCASTYRSDAITSDGMLTIDRNCESTKGSVSVRGDSLESAKTSVSRASDSSGLSDDSNWSNITGSANKPHKGNDPRWNAILAIRARDGILGMSHFRLFKRLGCGDIGSVYLSELSGTRCFFAMKVMDKASLASRKKLTRAQTEREILQLLDHPFLPTLYTHFETDRFSCLVMEYCPGGDLHTLRQRQPGKHFSEHAARFYAAEVLLALEYLHMLGVVYRDLKPENVLVRDDGHIMLSDFDLSLRCAVSPTLIRTSFNSDPSKRAAGGAFCVQPACIEPSSVCIQPACSTPPEVPRPVETEPSPGKFGAVDKIGVGIVGSSSKRMAGTDMKSGVLRTGAFDQVNDINGYLLPIILLSNANFTINSHSSNGLGFAGDLKTATVKIFQFVKGRMIVPVSMKVRSISSNGGGHALGLSMVIEVWIE